MKTVFLWNVFLLTGSVSCNPTQVKISSEKLPEWLPNLPQVELPEWFPNIPEVIPEKPEGLSDLPSIPVWWQWFLAQPRIDRGTIEEFALHDININKPIPGTPASVDQFPGIVQIEVGSGPIWAQGCAGCVLTSVHVLTAARCFSGRLYSDRFRRVRAGSSRRYKDGIIVNVADAIVHPSFLEGKSYEGDIAVVRLSAFLAFGPTIQQTPIVAAGFDLPGGLPVIHAGWGSTAQGIKIPNRGLFSIELLSVDNAECADLWRHLPLERFAVTSNMICAARPESGGRDADVRDVGGPIFYDGVLIGTVTFGSRLGNQRFPLVGTAVSAYTKWIVENAV